MWTDFNNSITFGFIDKLRNRYNKIFHHTWILFPHYLVKFTCSNVQRFIHTLYSVLAGLMNIDPYYQRQKCRSVTVVSANINHLYRYSKAFLAGASSYLSGVVEIDEFAVFSLPFISCCWWRSIVVKTAGSAGPACFPCPALDWQLAV